MIKRDVLKVTDLKDMLNKTGEIYGNNDAFKKRIKQGKEIEENEYRIYKHKEVREMINALGTALLKLGLKDKRIAVIGENRLEWENAY